jgi:hypothetical protein
MASHTIPPGGSAGKKLWPSEPHCSLLGSIFEPLDAKVYCLFCAIGDPLSIVAYPPHGLGNLDDRGSQRDEPCQVGELNAAVLVEARPRKPPDEQCFPSLVGHPWSRTSTSVMILNQKTRATALNNAVDRVIIDHEAPAADHILPQRTYPRFGPTCALASPFCCPPWDVCRRLAVDTRARRPAMHLLGTCSP